MMDFSHLLVAICVHRFFAAGQGGRGKPVRILESPNQECQIAKNCQNVWRIQKSDLVNPRTQLQLSDEKARDHTSSAWKAVSGQGNHYKGQPGRHVNLFYKAKTGARFQAREICIWVKHVSYVRALYCDTTVNKEDLILGCNEDLSDPEQGHVVTASVIDPTQFTRICINRWIPVTIVNLKFQFDGSSSDGDRIELHDLLVWACADRFFLKYGDPRLGREDRSIFHSIDACNILHELKFPRGGNTPNFFNFDDGDPERNEMLALERSRSQYTGATGRPITFTFSARDGKDFEWWKVCVRTQNVKTIKFILETKDEVLIKEREICEPGPWTRTCYPNQVKRTNVIKGSVKLILPRNGRNRAIIVKDMFIAACRDNHYFNFVLYRNPGDYKVMRLSTIRKQYITVYGTKNTAGELIATEMYHFTDGTGNLGDNILFVTHPELKLVSDIWSSHDHLKFSWNLRDKKVLVSITSRSDDSHDFETFQHYADILIDLETLQRTGGREFTPRSGRRSRCTSCLRVPVTIERCGRRSHDNLVLAYVRGSRGNAQIPARNIGRPGRFEVILPQKRQAANNTKQLCNMFTEIANEECKLFQHFKHQHYKQICVHIKDIYETHTEIRLEDRLRIAYACRSAFVSTEILCRVVQDSPRPSQPTYFTSACSRNVNFTTRDLFQQLGNTNTVRVRITANDSNAVKLSSNEQMINLRRNKNKFEMIGNEFTIINITTSPAPKKGQTYKLSVHFNCARAGDKIILWGNVALEAGLPISPFLRFAIGETGPSSATVTVNPQRKNSIGLDKFTFNHVRRTSKLVRFITIAYGDQVIGTD